MSPVKENDLRQTLTFFSRFVFIFILFAFISPHSSQDMSWKGIHKWFIEQSALS